eukprot:gene23327-30570_t
MSHLKSHAQKQLSHFNILDLTNMLWSVASLKSTDPEKASPMAGQASNAFVAAMVQAIHPLMEHCNSQMLCNIMWALAELKYQDTTQDTKTMARLVEVVKGRIDRMNVIDLGFLISPITSSRWRDPELMDLICERLLYFIGREPPQPQSHQSKRLSRDLKGASSEGEQSLRGKWQREVTATSMHMVRCLASLGLAPNPALLALVDQSPSRDIELLSGVAWAYTVWGGDYPLRILRQVLESVNQLGGQYDRLSVETRLQLQLYFNELQASGRSIEGRVDPMLLQACRESWLKVLARNRGNKASSYQGRVRSMVKRTPGCQVLGVEYLTDDRMHSIDVAVLLSTGDSAGSFSPGRALEVYLDKEFLNLVLTKLAETKLVETKLAETKLVETKLAESNPAETNDEASRDQAKLLALTATNNAKAMGNPEREAVLLNPTAFAERADVSETAERAEREGGSGRAEGTWPWKRTLTKEALANRIASLTKDALANRIASLTKEALANRIASLTKEALANRIASLTKEALANRIVSLTKEALANRIASLTKEALANRIVSLTKEALANRIASLTKEALADRIASLTKDALANRIASLTKEALANRIVSLNKEAFGQ